MKVKKWLSLPLSFISLSHATGTQMEKCCRYMRNKMNETRQGKGSGSDQGLNSWVNPCQIWVYNPNMLYSIRMIVHAELKVSSKIIKTICRVLAYLALSLDEFMSLWLLIWDKKKVHTKFIWLATYTEAAENKTTKNDSYQSTTVVAWSRTLFKLQTKR